MYIDVLTEKIASYAKRNKDGFTLNIRTLQPVKSGFVVSYKATQNSFAKLELQSVINHALKHDCVVGGWFNETDGKYYFDSNKVFDINELEQAVEFGIKNEQLAIFDIDNMREIRLDNEVVTAKEFSFSSFADWMLNIADQVVKHYRGDILIDAKQIVELRNKHFLNPQRAGNEGFSLYWGVRETGTWLFHVERDNGVTLKELMRGLGAENVYFITFWYDGSGDEIITVREVDKNNL
jgi:fructokinase